jgi:hypothetical protein
VEVNRRPLRSIAVELLDRLVGRPSVAVRVAETRASAEDEATWYRFEAWRRSRRVPPIGEDEERGVVVPFPNVRPFDRDVL